VIGRKEAAPTRWAGPLRDAPSSPPPELKWQKELSFIWVSDSCFSGDLACEFVLPKRKIKSVPMPADIAWRMRTAETIGTKRTSFEHVLKSFNAVLVSGCGARETSADAEIVGRFNGALTYYFLQTLSAPAVQPLHSPPIGREQLPRQPIVGE
jgi:hypothetical protein